MKIQAFYHITKVVMETDVYKLRRDLIPQKECAQHNLVYFWSARDFCQQSDALYYHFPEGLSSEQPY